MYSSWKQVWSGLISGPFHCFFGSFNGTVSIVRILPAHAHGDHKKISRKVTSENVNRFSLNTDHRPKSLRCDEILSDLCATLGPSALNALSDYLKNSTLSLSVFRNQLKHILFSSYSHSQSQRVRGYHRNALYKLLTYLLTLRHVCC